MKGTIPISTLIISMLNTNAGSEHVGYLPCESQEVARINMKLTIKGWSCGALVGCEGGRVVLSTQFEL